MNLVTEFRNHIRTCLELANAKYGLYDMINKKCIDREISINFYNAADGVAGFASHTYEGDKIKRLTLQFNAMYIESDNAYMVNDTIPHEIAHLLCYLMYPGERVGHDHRWNSICINIGGSGKRYHQMKGHNSKKKSVIVYEYNVDGKKVYLSFEKHIKAQKSFINHAVNGSMTRIHKTMYTGHTYMSEK